MELTCEDMEIVGYYLLKNNTVKIILLILCSSKIQNNFSFTNINRVIMFYFFGILIVNQGGKCDIVSI
jgi:hypothetical protein